MDKKVCIVGFGKLGQSIFRIMDKIEHFNVTHIVDLRSKEELLHLNDELEGLIDNIAFTSSVTNDVSECDIIIDSTVRDAFVENIKQYEKLKKTLIIATTNIEDMMPEIIELSKYNPIVREPNYDFGLLKFRDLMKDIYSKFNYMSPSIIEVHHEKKIDVSGTAKLLASELKSIVSDTNKNVRADFKLATSSIYIPLENENIILEYNIDENSENELFDTFKKYFDEDLSIKQTYDFSFANSRRFDTDYEGINITSIREGNIVGIHTVRFTNESTHEFINISHEVKSRDVFASGIVKVAQDIGKFKNGMHSIREFL